MMATSRQISQKMVHRVIAFLGFCFQRMFFWTHSPNWSAMRLRMHTDASVWESIAAFSQTPGSTLRWQKRLCCRLNQSGVSVYMVPSLSPLQQPPVQLRGKTSFFVTSPVYSTLGEFWVAEPHMSTDQDTNLMFLGGKSVFMVPSL